MGEPQGRPSGALYRATKGLAGMWQHLVTVLKGMAFGLGNIVPGMDGSSILIVMGAYEQFVDAVGNFFINRARRREYTLFLGALGLGVAIALVTLSRVLTFLLDWQPVLMMFIFMGLLLGAIPSLLRLHNDMRITPRRLLAVAAGLCVVVAIRALDRQNYQLGLLAESGSIAGIVYAFIAAFLAGAANIAPGLSGAYFFLLLGTYEPIMEALSALATLTIHWGILVPTAVGAALGIVICSKVVDTALKRAPGATTFFILGLVAGSVYGLWPDGSLQRENPLLLIAAVALGLAVPLLLGRRAAVTAHATSRPLGQVDRQPEA